MKNKSKHTNKKTGKLFPLLILTIVLIALLDREKITDNGTSVSDIQKGIAESIVRFHVVSAGDSEYEQSLKLLVKNTVLDFLSEKLADVTSKEETLTVLEELKPEITKLAAGVLRKNNCSISVSTNIEDTFFPVKTYGDLTLPAGEYTALKIVLGEGEGTNWWCVLYPRLCFVDATYGVVPDESKAVLKTVLAEDEYNLVFGENVVFRFKILKFLNKFF